MPWITPPDEPPNTIFWDIALLFWRMYLRWDILATEVQDVWLLGTHLYTGFTYLRDYAAEGYWFFDDANTLLQNIIRWVDGLTSGNVLYRLIQELFPNLVAIIDNVLDWFEDVLLSYSNDLYQLAASSWMWVRNQLYDQTEWFWDFINTPGNFILDRIDLWYNWFRSFFDNPLDYVPEWVRDSFTFISELEVNPTYRILTWIERWFDWFGDFLNNPTDYIYYWITLINEELRQILDNPVMWFRDSLGWYLDIRPTDWSNVYYRLIGLATYRIRNNKERYEVIMEKLIVQLLLWFM